MRPTPEWRYFRRSRLNPQVLGLIFACLVVWAVICYALIALAFS